MSRIVVVAICTLGFVVGCEQPRPPEDFFQKPSPAAELAKLERLLGSWAGTAEMVSPTPEEMKAMMPEGAEELPSEFAGESKMEWALGGMFLKGEGWHEMGTDKKVHYVEYWTWDPKAKKYHAWYFSDWGEFGEGWASFSKDGNSMDMEWTGFDARGAKSRGEGTIAFVDDDTHSWTWTEKGPMGKMKMKGTARREQ